ncbi:MAG TPA: hypothetical protein VKY41_10540 [Xanthomarina sp.]|nr:hypothetical protein [Xanthomarina sp.]
MSIEINTYSKVLKSFSYLEKQLERANLNKAKAILYFQILLNIEQEGIIERPYFTYALEDYKRYLHFFKKYNFIQDALNANTFRLAKDWKDKRERYIVPIPEKNDFLKLTAEFEELTSCCHISA